MGRDADENVHILATGRGGDLYDFTKGDDRPRLQLNSYKVKVPVEPGTDPAAAYYIDDIITNTGCAPLNIYSCVISTEDTGAFIPNYSVKNIRPDVFNKAASIADMLTTSKLPTTYDINSTEVSFDVLNVPAEKGYNQASAATYLEDLIQGVYVPAVVNAGETVAIELTVDETVVQRGGALFYLVFDTDDPDFFLNSPPRLPQIQVIAVGGCLIDTVRMSFGMSGENTQLVTNTGRVGDGDWDPHGFEIDGDGGSYYQGSYIYGVSKYRIAMNCEDWWSNTGEGNGFYSMQADPNWCDANCSPYMTDECDMGEIWDEVTSAYVTVEGYMVCKTYIDSVQAFYDPDDTEGDLWTWRRDNMEGGYDMIPFDDTLTIGLMVRTRTFGAGHPDYWSDGSHPYLWCG